MRPKRPWHSSPRPKVFGQAGPSLHPALDAPIGTSSTDRAVKLGDVADHPAPGWLYDAHLLLAEAVRGSNKPRAIESYRRFLELAPHDSPYVSEAEKALASLGATVQR